jgi:hypothetical protein
VERPLMLLDQAAHPTLSDSATAPDLDRVVRDLATASREVILQEGHRAGEGLRLLRWGSKSARWLGVAEGNEGKRDFTHIW